MSGGRPAGKRTVPDGVIIDALPGYTTQIAARVGLERSSALYRLKHMPGVVTKKPMKGGRPAYWMRDPWLEEARRRFLNRR